MKALLVTLTIIVTFVSGSLCAYAVPKGGKGGKGPNSGKPIPQINDDQASAGLIADRIAADTGWPKEEMIPYATRLAKTLSQLSAKEQAEVFYGS